MERITKGEVHVLEFVTDEWQPASTIAAFANRGIESVTRMLKILEQKGKAEKMWDGNLGMHYWRLRQDPVQPGAPDS